MTKESSEQAMLVYRLRAATKGCRSRSSASILLSLVHLLLERFGLLLINKAQSRQTTLKLKGVEECTVLIVVPSVVDLLVPYDASVAGLCI